MKVLGLDIGFGDTKAVLMDENCTVLKKLSFPTLLAPYIPDSIRDEEIKVFTWEEHSYIVGEDARLEMAPFRLVDAEDMKKYAPVILKAVMAYMDIKGVLPVCASIPPGWWEMQSELRSVLSSVMGLPVIIAPQGMGAYTLAVHRKLLPSEGVFLVLDFGHNTVDYLLIQKLKGRTRIVRRDTHSEIGVTRLAEIFKRELPVEFRDFPEHTIKQMLRDGKARIYGEEKSFREEKTRAEQKYSEMLNQVIKAQLGQQIYKQVDAICLTGGGTHYFSPQSFEGYRNIITLPEPEMANAIGQALILVQEACRH